MTDAHLLDELAANATAAGAAQLVEGWLLRAAPDMPFQRCNSVAVLGDDDAAALDRRLAVAAEFARRRGIPLTLQVSVEPHAAIDAELARRGLGAGERTLVETAPAELVGARAGCAPGVAASVAEGATPAWDDERTQAYARLFARIGPRSALATATLAASTADGGGDAAGIGFGVVERGWLGVYGRATLPHARRRGVATAVIGALVAWARGHGATGAYLQVEEHNHGARALYDRLGFRRSHSYHYRTGA